MRQEIIGCILLLTVTVANSAFRECKDPNEYLHGCGLCQATCANPDLKPCDEGVRCFAPVCICKPGFVRVSDTDRRCIRVCDCDRVPHGGHGGGGESCGCDDPCLCKK